MKIRSILVSFVSLLTVLTTNAQCDLDFDFVNTGSNMTVLYTPGAVYDIASITDIGTIGAFFQNNSGEYICASAMEYSGSQTQLPLMADDSTTPQKDGFSDGETIHWFFQTNSGTVYQMETNPADVFVLNSISFITSVDLSEIDCNPTGEDCTPLETEFSNTGSNMTMFVKPSAAESLSDIGEGIIAAYFINYSGEVCGGSVEFDGNQNSFPAMGDDATTEVKDGFSNGEEIIWKFQADDGSQYNLTPIPNDVFSLNAISFVSSFIVEQTCGGESVPVEGCTDELACNFDSFANLNDGSCQYPTDGFDCDGNCTSGELLTLGGGAWISEVFFVISDCDGNVLLQDGGEALSMCVDLPENYSISMTDSYGDGWQDNVLTIGEQQFTLENGSEGSDLVGTCGVYGCTGPSSCNYNPEATIDDGSCVYNEAYLDCEGACINDADLDGVCDEYEIVGCTDETACNYNSYATDAGDCTYVEFGYDCDGDCLTDTDGDGVCDADEVAGCQEPTACNYNADATDAGDCTYAASGYDCDGDCLTDTDGDSICDADEVAGCQEPTACNYNADATDAGDCTYVEFGYDCDGDCLTDTDGDGVCDEFEVAGCMDSYANNYNADATDDDNSCFYDSNCGCTDSNYIEYYTQGFVADCDNGSCDILTQSYGITSEHFNTPWNTAVNMTIGFELGYNMMFDGAQIAAFSDLNGDGTISTDTFENTYGDLYFECVGLISYDNEFFAMALWGDDATTDEIDGATLGTQEIIFAILMTNGDVIVFNPEPEFNAFEPNGLLVFENLNFDVTVYGCMDPAYCNYNESAEEDDGSCEGLFGCTDEIYVEFDTNASCYLDEACVITWQSAFEFVEAELNEMNIYNADLQEELYTSNQEINELWTALEDQISVSVALGQDLDQANETIADYESQVQSLLSQISDLSNTLEAANQWNADLSAENAALSNALAEANEWNTVLNAELAEANEWNTVLNATNSDLSNTLEAANQWNADLSTENAVLSNELAEANEWNTVLNATNSELSNTLEAANQWNADLSAENASLSNELAEANEWNTALNATNSDLNDELSAALTLISDLETQLNELQALLEMAESLIDEQGNSIEDQLLSITDLESEVSMANVSILELEGHIAELTSANAYLEEQLLSCNDMNASLTSQIEELILENEYMASANDSLSSPILIDLLYGWNIIGYTLQNPQDAVATFDGIVDILSVVKNNGGEVYWPEFGYNGIGDLIPGQGYQVRVEEAYNNFIFEDLDGLRIEIQPTVPQWAIDMDVFIHPNDIRTLVRVINNLGQEVDPNSEFKGALLYYLYNDGTVEKHLN